MSTGKKAGIFIFVTVLVLAAGVVGFGWWVQRHLDGMIERIDDPFGEISSRPEIPDEVIQEAEEEDKDLPVNILVLGSDSENLRRRFQSMAGGSAAHRCHHAHAHLRRP